MAARLASTSSYRPWSAPELLALRTLYPAATRATIEAALPGRAWGAIQDAGYRNGVARDVYWTDAEVAQLIADYPTKGAKAIALAMGTTVDAVRARASKEGVRYVRPPRVAKPRPVREPKAAKAPKVPAPKAVKAPKAPAPKPMLPKPEPVVAVKRSPGTPRLNAQKIQAAQSAAAKKCHVVYTSEEIKRLDWHHPIRQAHWQGGDRAVRAYLAAQQAA